MRWRLSQLFRATSAQKWHIPLIFLGMLPKSHQEKVKAIAISIMPSTIPRFHDLRLLRGTTRAFVYFHSMTFNIYHIYKNMAQAHLLRSNCNYTLAAHMCGCLPSNPSLHLNSAPYWVCKMQLPFVLNIQLLRPIFTKGLDAPYQKTKS